MTQPEQPSDISPSETPLTPSKGSYPRAEVIQPVSPLLTIVPELGTLSLQAADGTVLVEPTSMWNIDKVNATEAADFLAAAHTVPDGGPGEYSIPEIARLTGRNATRADDIIRHLTPLVPQIIQTEGKREIEGARLVRDSHGSVLIALLTTFGSVSLREVRIAGRKPTEAEVQARAELRAVSAEKRTAKLERYKAELLEADPRKTNLTQQDHAIVTIQDQQYHVPLGKRMAIAGARVLEALSMPASYVFHDEVDDNRLRRQVWELMSVDERSLFSDKDHVVHGPTPAPEAVNAIGKTLGKLTSQLGITEAGYRRRHARAIGQHDLQVRYSDQPLEPAEAANLTTLYAPETPEHLVRADAAPKSLSADDHAFAELTLETLRSSAPGVSHQDAIDIMSFVMSTEGKYALLDALRREGHGERYAATLENLHTMLRRSLGSTSYWVALRERMIKGYSTKGSQAGVKQVSGGLPTTTRWHIGVQSDQAKTWHDRFEK